LRSFTRSKFSLGPTAVSHNVPEHVKIPAAQQPIASIADGIVCGVVGRVRVRPRERGEQQQDDECDLLYGFLISVSGVIS
jgi:hypothetical protein